MNIAALATVLDDVLAHLRCSIEEGWAQHRPTPAIVAEVEALRGRIGAGDPDALPLLHILFAPTGTLQEISIANGWGHEYIALASSFDGAAGRS